MPDQRPTDQPVVPFTPPTLPRAPGDVAVDAFYERLALEISNDVEGRIALAFPNDDDLKPLFAVFAGFGAARLLPPAALAAALANDPPLATTPLPWPTSDAIRDHPSEGELLAFVAGFRRGPYVGDEWAVERELERQQDFALEVVPGCLQDLGDLVPDAVIDWLDPRLGELLDDPAVASLRMRDMVVVAYDASLSGFRRVTQGFKLNRSEEQWFAAARKERQRALARSTVDEVADTLVEKLTAAYAAWLARETPPLGVALLVAAHLVMVTAELRGVTAVTFASRAPVLVPCRDYLATRVAIDDWYACGRAGLAAWPNDTARYWNEGLAALVPYLSAERRDARRAQSGGGAGSSDRAGDTGGSATEADPGTAPPRGETLKRWQERLRAQVQELTRKQRELEGAHTATLARVHADHARALAAAEEERDALHRRLIQAEQTMEAVTASLRRVERDAQLAMRRVVQLEEALEAQGGVAPVLETLDGAEGDGEDDGGSLGVRGAGESAPLPADCFAGHRVFVFTGQLRQGVHEHMAEPFRRLGADEVEVRLSHRDHGPPAFRAGDCVVIDLRFAAHADTKAIRAKAEAAGAWVFQAKRGASTLAEAAGRAWEEWRARRTGAD